MKLSKSFQTKKDVFGFTNEIEITVNYEPEIEFITDVKVTLYEFGKRDCSDITEFFSVPPFAKIVDDIDWPQMAREVEEEKAKQAREKTFDQGSFLEMAMNISRDHAKREYGIDILNGTKL